MSVSNSARLQNLVLSIASRDDKGLDLSKVSGDKAAFPALSSDSVQAGDQVVVVGAGDGRVAYQAAKLAGAKGYVLALESDEELLKQASAAGERVEGELGFANWKFLQTELDDLATNPRFLTGYLATRTVDSVEAYRALQSELDFQRTETPLIGAASVDVVILDTVVNRLPASRVRQALSEAARVLKPGGRLVVLAALADEKGTGSLPLVNGLPAKNAPLETEIAERLESEGFYGVTYNLRADLPLQVLDGVEYRAFLLTAYKGVPGADIDQGHAVLYKGPWQEVVLAEGQRLVRGERTAVSARIYERLTRAPYRDQVDGIPMYVAVSADNAPAFDAATPRLRDPQVTKGKQSLRGSSSDASCCEPSASDCCDTGSSCGC